MCRWSRWMAAARRARTETLSARFLRQFRCMPLAAARIHTLTLAMADPLDFETIAAVRALHRPEIEPRWPEQEIDPGRHRQALRRERQAAQPSRSRAGAANEDLEHLRDMASEAPVIRLVNAMIAQAVERRASDIHIEPFEKEFRVRYRVDGVLVNQEARRAS
jgi:general secretion pathway protein E